jgi:hypothetical protein
MRLLSVAALAGHLLCAPAVTYSDFCSCADAGRSATCIDCDSEGAGIAPALKLPVTPELRAVTNLQLSDELLRITGKLIAVLPTKPDEAINYQC